MKISPNRVRLLRQERGIPSQMALAVEAGVSLSLISMIEAHDYVPIPECREKIANALDAPVAEVWPEIPQTAEVEE